MLITLPFIVTLKIFLITLSFFDSIIEIQHGHFLFFVPERFHPETLLHMHIPGLGAIFTVICIIIVGGISRLYFGKWMVEKGDQIFSQMPLVKSIYSVVKEMLQLYSNKDKNDFYKVILVEFPRKDAYTLAFMTGHPPKSIQSHFEESMVNIFVPTSPSPLNGFYLVVSEKSIKPIDMSVEHAIKMIVAAGATKNDETKA